MRSYIIATAILNTMPRKYARLGIFFKQRRSYGRILFATLLSCLDIVRLSAIMLSSKWSKFDKVVIAPMGVVQVNDKLASVKKYDDLLEWQSTVIIVRSTRGVSAQRATNLFDLTSIYVLVAASALVISYLMFKKRTMKVALICCMTSIFSKLIKGKRSVYISDWTNPFSISCILASKKHNIQSTELQHGVIHVNHPAYNFSSSRVQKIGCDYLNYWLLPRDSAFLSNLYPREKRVLYDCLESKPFSFKEDKTIDILFSLQDSNSSDFINAILPIIETAGTARIVIKPRRSLSKELQEKIYCQSPTVEIISNGNFDSLLSKSHIHVSHSSTTLLDGAFHKNLTNICYDFDGTALHRNPVIEDLIENNQVQLIKNHLDLLTLWSIKRQTI